MTYNERVQAIAVEITKGYSGLLLVLLTAIAAILFFKGAGGDTPLWKVGDLPGAKGMGGAEIRWGRR